MRALRMAALVLLLAGTARAFDVGPGVGVAEPPLLRVTGFVSGAPQGARTVGSETFGVGPRIVKLELTAVQTLNSSLTEGPAALRQFDLYTPNLELIGEPSLLDSVRDAPEHSEITLWGYVMTGAQRLLLVKVEAK